MHTDDTTTPKIPTRDPRGHKGTFGTVVIIGGCASETPGVPRMIGAPALAARGALRAGCGLAKMLLPDPIVNAAITLTPSATCIPIPVDEDGVMLGHEAAALLDEVLPDTDALVVGPGLSDHDSITRGKRGLDAHGPAATVLRAIQQQAVPVVLDADGLNLLARIPEFWRDIKSPLILTPHPGEFRRLAAALRIASDPTDPATRADAASELARRVGAIVVLKGAGTVVSDGHRSWTCTRGHACLATAGTGDVLAGVIAGYTAQFRKKTDAASHAILPGVPAQYHDALRRMHAKSNADTSPTTPATASATAFEGVTLDLYDAARLGVLIHAIAGERWASSRGQSGLLADELADEIPDAAETLRNR